MSDLPKITFCAKCHEAGALKQIQPWLEYIEQQQAEIERLRAAIDAGTKYIALADERIAKLEKILDKIRAVHADEELDEIDRDIAVSDIIAALKGVDDE